MELPLALGRSSHPILAFWGAISLLLLGNEKAARCMLLKINYAKERSRISCVLLPSQSEISENHRILSGISRALKVCFNIWGKKTKGFKSVLKSCHGAFGIAITISMFLHQKRKADRAPYKKQHR